MIYSIPQSLAKYLKVRLTGVYVPQARFNDGNELREARRNGGGTAAECDIVGGKMKELA